MSKSLLVADDSLTIRKVIGMIFATEDFQITAVDNGLEAITRARDLRPDLVLADVTMPGKSGYEVCEAIKSDPEMQHIPVLLLAGTFEPFDENRARGAQADDYIVKPFESQALLDKVRALTGVPKPAEIPRKVFVPDSGPKPSYPIGAVPRSAPAPSAISSAPQSTGGPAGPRPGAPAYPMTPGAPRPTHAGPPGAATGRPPAGAMPQTGLPRAPAAQAYPPAPGAPQYRMPTGAVPRAPAPGPAPGMGAPQAPYGYQPPMPGPATLPRSPAMMRPGMPGPAAGGPFPRPPAQAPMPRMPPPGYAPAPQPRAPYPPPPQAMRPSNYYDPRYDPRQAPYPQPVGYPPDHRMGGHPQPYPPASADGGEAALRMAISNASREVIEKIAWEVIPQLAEAIIREHVEQLVKDREGRN